VDLRLDGDGDLDTSDSQLHLTEGAEAVRQHWQIRNKFFLGEWFLDRRIGVAFHQVVFKKGSRAELIRAIFRRVLSSTPGIRSVQAFTASFDSQTRTLSIAAEGFLEAGIEPRDPAIFRFEFDDFIIPDQVPPDAAGV